MCGRARQTKFESYADLIFGWLYPAIAERRSNIKPTEEANIVARLPDGEIKVVAANWWCQWDNAWKFETGYPTFNARVETMHDKKLWPELLAKGKRCVMPVDSFYEWPVKGRGIPPVEITVEGQEAFGLPGLWSTWHENGVPKYSFAIFTTDPNDFMKPIHPKAMPVILADKDEQKLWLMEGDEELLRPYAGDLKAVQLHDTLERLFPEETSSSRSTA